MNIDTKTYVVGLLESYQKRSKQIDLLHYELSHPARVSENEMIGADKVVEQLVELEREQERLNYYVSLFEGRHKKVIQMFCFEWKTPDEVAKTFQVTIRYAHFIKSKAINELVAMYEYVGALR